MWSGIRTAFDGRLLLFVQYGFITHVLCASFCVGHDRGEGWENKMRLDTVLALQEFTHK